MEKKYLCEKIIEKAHSEWKIQQTRKKGKIYNMPKKCFHKNQLFLLNKLILLDAEINTIEKNQGFIEIFVLQKQIFH